MVEVKAQGIVGERERERERPMKKGCRQGHNLFNYASS